MFTIYSGDRSGLTISSITNSFASVQMVSGIVHPLIIEHCAKEAGNSQALMDPFAILAQSRTTVLAEDHCIKEGNF